MFLLPARICKHKIFRQDDLESSIRPMGRPRRLFAYTHLDDHEVPGQASTVDPCADLRAAVRSWEEKTNRKVGDLRTPELMPRGQWMTTGCCHRCTGCHAGDGRRYKFLGEPGEAAYKLTILSAGECVGRPEASELAPMAA